MVKFSSFGLSKPSLEAVKIFGFKKPTEIQKKIIPLILEGKDVIACAKTGSGKTLAYLLPLMDKLRERTGLVGTRLLILVPTRELALQTSVLLKKFLKFNDLKYSLIVGGHDYIGQFESLSTNPDVIVATPGRLLEILKETEFSMKKIEFVVLDEADNFFEMGYREQLISIVDLINKDRQTIMLSATIPSSIKEFAQAGMREYVFAKLDSEYSLNDKLQMHFFSVKTLEKTPLLIYLLFEKINKKEQTIVFCSSRYWVDYLEYVLNNVFAITGSYLYGKMDMGARSEALNNFRERNTQVLVVTDLCARGIDIPNVENVINFDFPINIKIFIHRCGRTARAEESGNCYSFFSPGEIPYVYELEDKIDKKIVNLDQVENFEFNKIYLGKVDSQDLSEIVQKLNIQKKIDPEIIKLEKHCLNSNIKFNKTRFSWSKDSYFKAKTELISHPFFYNVNTNQAVLLQRLSDFKPQKSLFELKELKNHPNGEQIQNSINKLRSKVKKIKKNRKSLNKKTKTTEIQEENPNFEIEYDNNEIVENNKFNRDYKDKNFFVSYDQDEEKVEELKNLNKINPEDMQTILLADENQDLFKRQKNIWDKKNKKYKKVLINRHGERIDGNDLYQMKLKTRLNNLNKKFKSWKKSNQIYIQREGVEEDKQQTNKFSNMFNERKKNKFRVNKTSTQFQQTKFQTHSSQKIANIKKKSMTNKHINNSKKTKKIYKKKTKKRN